MISVCPHDAATALKRCAGSADDLLSEPLFSVCAVSCDPSLCPLLIFLGKRNNAVSTQHRAQRDIRAIDAGSICKESSSSSRPRWCGRRWESQQESYNLSRAAPQRTKAKFHVSTSAVFQRSQAVSRAASWWLQLLQGGSVRWFVRWNRSVAQISWQMVCLGDVLYFLTSPHFT